MAEHGASLADLLGRLFAAVHPPGRGPYTNREVVTAIAATGGPGITVQYLSQLRNGERTNPTKDVMEGLARFFDVPAAYFFDSEQSTKIAEDLEFLALLRDAGVREMALRAVGLTPRSKASITAMIEHIRALEGLDEGESPDEPEA